MNKQNFSHKKLDFIRNKTNILHKYYLCNRFHQFLYNFREMRLLERVDFCGKSVGGVGRGDRTTELGNRRSRVDTFRHIVDGDAALRLAGGDNGAMHIFPTFLCLRTSAAAMDAR